jgi:hypothetical protein
MTDRFQSGETDFLTAVRRFEYANQQWCYHTTDTKKLISLTDVANTWATELGIMGGAFAVLDPIEDSVVLCRHYLDSVQSCSLLNYKEPKALRDVHRCFSDRLAETGVDYSSFVHGLFDIERSIQSTDPVSRGENATLPEFIWARESTVYRHETICAVVLWWLTIWQSAAQSTKGFLSTLSDNAMPISTTKTLGEIVNAGIDNSRVAIRSGLKINKDYERFLNPNNQGFHSALIQEFLAKCSVEQLLAQVRDSGKKVFEELRVSILNRRDPLLKLLANLTTYAEFPIVPYLFLIATSDEPLAHFVSPLHWTSELSYKHNIVVEDKKETISCGLFVLATVDDRNVASQDAVTRLGMACKCLGQPILDNRYFGGFQRKLIERDMVSESIRSFAHQIRSLASSIDNKWLVLPSEWPDLKSSAAKAIEYLDTEEDQNVAFQVVRQKADAYRIAPDPRMFSALSSTLKIWSLTFTLADLFDNSGIGPQNASELFQVASAYAQDCTYLRKTSGFDRTDSEDLARAWLCKEFYGKRTVDIANLKDLGFEFQSDICDWSKPVDEFRYHGNEGEANSSRRFAIELVGLFRLNVLAIENFFLHSTGDATLKTSWETVGNGNDRIRLLWETAGVKAVSNDERLFLSFRGREVFDFVTRTFLKYRRPIVSLSEGLYEKRYWCSVEIDKPSWCKVENRYG